MKIKLLLKVVAVNMNSIFEIISYIAAHSEGLIMPEEIQWKDDLSGKSKGYEKGFLYPLL